jgi:hypothetical protein
MLDTKSRYPSGLSAASGYLRYADQEEGGIRGRCDEIIEMLQPLNSRNCNALNMNFYILNTHVTKV